MDILVGNYFGGLRQYYSGGQTYESSEKTEETSYKSSVYALTPGPNTSVMPELPIIAEQPIL
jgi:hypothetical protein